MEENNCLSQAEIENKLRIEFNPILVENDETLDHSTNLYDEILYYCTSKSKDLIPVICEDMYEYEDPETHKRQSLRSHIIWDVFSSLHAKGMTFSQKEFKDIATGSYYGIQLLEEKLHGRQVYPEVFKSVIDFASHKVREGICLKKEVEEFLQLGDFPLIITTSCFPILEEKALTSYNYIPFWYTLQSNENGKKNDDKKDTDTQPTISELPSKCIYHIFGEANFSRAEWGYNDRRVLEYLKSACSSEFAMEKLTSYISNKKKVLLFLGNDAPDWLFRFILTPIYGRNVYEIGTDYYIAEKKVHDEERLDHFLRDIHFEKESKLIDVLTKVNLSLRKHKNANIVTVPPVKGHSKQYDFFISHASEDNEMVKKLVKKLNDHGITQIWVDYEKIKSGTYWKKIIDGIRNSAYFIPIVTEHFIAKTQGFKEQTMALEKANLTSITFEAEAVRNLNDYLDGVQVELLLASKHFTDTYPNPDSTYSLPILQKGCTFHDFPVDTEKVEDLGQRQRLPRNLFRGKQIKVIDFNEEDLRSLDLDWDTFKSEKELNNEHE